jgi:glutamate racemase
MKRSIGLFDSGIGGLTVMHQVIRSLPHENLIYFGDTARVPYGGKSRETILRYAIESSIFLMQQQIKMLIIPCNTVSAYALDSLRQIFNIPVIGVIEPGAEKAVKTTREGRIAVLGTKATIQSGAYQKEIEKRMPGAYVLPIACPLFVPLVEEIFLSHPATKLIIKEYLQPLKKEKIDTLLLGCTHYPLLREAIQEEVGPDVTLVDSASTCAETVAAALQESRMANPGRGKPAYKFYVSDDPKKFKALGETFLGTPIDHVEAISLNHG